MTNPFATCDLCDVYKADSSGDFRVLPPVFKDFGQVKKFSGPVVTIKCFEDNSLVKAAVDATDIGGGGWGDRGWAGRGNGKGGDKWIVPQIRN